jgi:hypothetical protein
MSHSRSPHLGAWLALAAVAAATLVGAGSSRAGEDRTVYTQTNLVSNLSGQAAVMDANLQNAWDVAFAPGGPFWVNDNNSGLSTLYRGTRTSYGFGQFSGDVLIGDFGDGRINVYDSQGRFLDQLEGQDGNPIVIDGLWALMFGGGATSSPDTLYFAAGPNREQDGLFGTITASPASGSGQVATMGGQQ